MKRTMPGEHNSKECWMCSQFNLDKFKDRNKKQLKEGFDIKGNLLISFFGFREIPEKFKSYRHDTPICFYEIDKYQKATNFLGLEKGDEIVEPFDLDFKLDNKIFTVKGKGFVFDNRLYSWYIKKGL